MNLVDQLLIAVQTNSEMYSKICKVTEVNGNTCSVEPLDESAPINNVRLIAGDSTTGVICVPKTGSVVVVTFMSESSAFVSMFSEIETVVIHGDQFGGLVKVDELRSQMDLMTARIDGIIDALKNTSPDSNTGTFKTSLTPGLAQVEGLQKENFKDVENETVKHG
jgi:acetoacetate decarboxylase